MSPKSGGRAQRRQRRNLLISVIVVVAIAVGSFAAVFAAKWSPRLGLDLAGGVAVVYTAEGAHVSQADLNETVNILNLRVNGLGVSGARGADHREEPDLGLHSRCHRRAAGAAPDRADGAHVLPPGGVLRLPRGRSQARAEELHAAPGHRDDPALHVVVRRSRRRTSTSQPDSNVAPGVHVEQRAARLPVRELPVDQRREAELRRTARSCCPAWPRAAAPTGASATSSARAR